MMKNIMMKLKREYNYKNFLCFVLNVIEAALSLAYYVLILGK